jgi:Domain of unknown function (DUF5666)/Domain of unknown function (DUF4382)
MRRKSLVVVFLVSAVAFTLAGCGGSSSATNSSAAGSSVAVLATDAPLGSVVAFEATITGFTLSGNGKTVSLVDTPATLEFSQLTGLQTLVDIQPVTPGTYTAAQITLGTATVSILDTSFSPPQVSTYPGDLVTSAVTVTFPQALNVGASQTLGLLLDFRLARSIETQSGQIVINASNQVVINPVINLRFLFPEQSKIEVDELRGGVTGIDSASGSFTLQNANGRQFTVLTTNGTKFEPPNATLNVDDLVEVEGVLDPATRMVKAQEVELLSRDHFFLAGLVTGVRPSVSGCASGGQVDLLVRAVLPGSAASAAPIGQIFTVNLTGNEIYWVGHSSYFSNLGFTFGPCGIIAGQQLGVGGALSTSGNPATLVPHRVMLELEGLRGDWVPGSTTSTGFSFAVNGLAGVLFQQFGNSVAVATTPVTEFVNLSGLGALSGSTPIPLHVGGLVFLDSNTNLPVVVALRVTEPQP